MPYYTKYHLSEHSANVLLEPICATLRELERRTQHYTERLHLAPGTGEALTAAHAALATARHEVERLHAESAAQAAQVARTAGATKEAK